MIFFADILSISEQVLLSEALAVAVSPASMAARMALRPVRSLDRSSRLCSVRLMVWRFAFTADLCRGATREASLWGRYSRPETPKYSIPTSLTKIPTSRGRSSPPWLDEDAVFRAYRARLQDRASAWAPRA